jgi:hypothetical protein
MSHRNQHAKHSEKRPVTQATAIALCIGAFLYFAVQWKFAPKIGPNKIFSAYRVTDQADFVVMIDSLSKAIHRTCNNGSLNTFLFDDGDSALPYLKIKGDRLDGCIMMRETNVTPFSKDEMDGCNVVYIREYEPSYSKLDLAAALQTYNTLHTSPWISIDRWVSNDERFGFALYRHPCSVQKDTIWN